MKKNSHIVREIRKSLGMTQAQFGNLLGVSEGYIGQVEKGREPSDTLIKLATLYAERPERALYKTPPKSMTLRENCTPYASGHDQLKNDIAEKAAELPDLDDEQALYALGGLSSLIDLLAAKLKNKLENLK